MEILSPVTQNPATTFALSAEVSPFQTLAPPVIIAHHLADREGTSRDPNRALFSTPREKRRIHQQPDDAERDEIGMDRVHLRGGRGLKRPLLIPPFRQRDEFTKRRRKHGRGTRVSSCRGCGARTTTSTSLPDRWIKLGGAVPVGVRTPHSLSLCPYHARHRPSLPLLSRFSFLSFLPTNAPTCAFPTISSSRRRHPSTLQGAPAHHHHHHPCTWPVCRRYHRR